jgi:hypothetical protein
MAGHSYEEMQKIVASRGAHFHRDIAEKFLVREVEAVAQYAELLRKAKAHGGEFLKSEYPDYDRDLEVLNGIQERMLRFDPSLTALDLFKILELVRTEIELRADPGRA